IALRIKIYVSSAGNIEKSSDGKYTYFFLIGLDSPSNQKKRIPYLCCRKLAKTIHSSLK
ncbi:13809_t:CDS:1, partial [Entrophospora sp. SA101]